MKRTIAEWRKETDRAYGENQDHKTREIKEYQKQRCNVKTKKEEETNKELKENLSVND